MNEADFYRGHVRSRLASWGDYARVENAVGTGMPDINYAIDGVQGWVEIKVAHANGCLYFQVFQLAWFRKRARHTRGSGLYVLALVGPSVCLYSADTLLEAPRTTTTRWVVIDTKILTPCATSQLKGPWPSIREQLAKR